MDALRVFFVVLFVYACHFPDAQRLDSAGWVNLRNAIIAVESEGDSTAVNGSSVGVLQITPVYVSEANRILGVEKYCLDDRLSVSKSIEMFEVVQGFWNKDRLLLRAIRLHNPRALRGYRMKVIKEFNEYRP